MLNWLTFHSSFYIAYLRHHCHWQTILFSDGWQETPSSSWSLLEWAACGHPHTWQHSCSAVALPAAPYFLYPLSLWLCHCSTWCIRPGSPRPFPAHWSPRPVLGALVYLPHRCLVVLTAVGTVPKHEALRLLVFFLHTFYNGVRSLLHLNCCTSTIVTLCCTMRVPCLLNFYTFFLCQSCWGLTPDGYFSSKRIFFLCFIFAKPEFLCFEFRRWLRANLKFISIWRLWSPACLLIPDTISPQRSLTQTFP